MPARRRPTPWLLCLLPACTLVRPLDELSSAPAPVSQPEPSEEAAGAAVPVGGEAPADNPPGKTPSGEALADSPSGETPSGEALAESPAGGTPSGEAPHGESWSPTAGDAGDAASELPDPSPPDAATPDPLCKSDTECLEGRCLEGGGGCQPCPPEMSLIRFPDGTAFCIDRFEVTQRQYAEFLASVLDRPDVAARPPCAGNASLEPSEDGACAGRFQPATDGDLPVSCVNVCDAIAYCLWAGKRLCGSKHGGLLLPSLMGDASSDEWQAACTEGTSRLYPYGGSYSEEACNVGAGVADAGVAVAGAHPACATGGGVHDLSGNVAEWTDCCGNIQGELRCAARGGSYAHENPLGLACNPAKTDGADPLFAPPFLSHEPHVGIRCCAD